MTLSGFSACDAERDHGVCDCQERADCNPDPREAGSFRAGCDRELLVDLHRPSVGVHGSEHDRHGARSGGGTEADVPDRVRAGNALQNGRNNLDPVTLDLQAAGRGPRAQLGQLDPDVGERSLFEEGRPNVQMGERRVRHQGQGERS